MKNPVERRQMLATAGIGALLLTGASHAGGAIKAGKILEVALAADIAGLDIGSDVAAIRTAGFRVIGLGGALYVPVERGNENLPILTSRDGRRFRLADDELSAIRPEVFGALGNASVEIASDNQSAKVIGDDDSNAISMAIRLAIQCASVVVLGARKYRIAKPLEPITSAMAIVGAGSLKTWLVVDPGMQGDAISVIETWLGKDPTEIGPANKMVAQPDGQSTGVTLSGFTLSGFRSASGPQNGIMLYERNDNVYISDVEVRHIKGRGFCSGISRRSPPVSLLRESRIDRFQVRRCGDNERGLPAFELSSDGFRPHDDASNNISITDLLVIYSSDRAVVMDNRNAAHDMRYIVITGAYIEGADRDVWTVRGSVSDLEVYGFDLNGSRNPDAAALLFEASDRDAFTRPPRRCYFSGAFGPVVNGIKVRHGKALYFRLTSNGASGTSVAVEKTCSGPVKFDGSGEERVWRFKVDPQVAHFVTVESGQRTWSINAMPNAAALFNSLIVVRQSGDGQCALARSDGRDWHSVSLQKMSLPGKPS